MRQGVALGLALLLSSEARAGDEDAAGVRRWGTGIQLVVDGPAVKPDDAQRCRSALTRRGVEVRSRSPLVYRVHRRPTRTLLTLEFEDRIVYGWAEDADWRLEGLCARPAEVSEWPLSVLRPTTSVVAVVPYDGMPIFYGTSQGLQYATVFAGRFYRGIRGEILVARSVSGVGVLRLSLSPGAGVRLGPVDLFLAARINTTVLHPPGEERSDWRGFGFGVLLQAAIDLGRWAAFPRAGVVALASLATDTLGMVEIGVGLGVDL